MNNAFRPLEGDPSGCALEVESDHLGEASVKIGFVKFGFLDAGSDDAHGRCEGAGQFCEDLVKVKQQVQ